MRILNLSVAVMALALFVGGCGAQKGSTVMSLGKGDTPQSLSSVAEGRGGQYAVYANTSLTPLRSETLNAGDEFGFAKGDDGKMYAVLGNARVPLESTLSTGYYIKYQK